MQELNVHGQESLLVMPTAVGHIIYSLMPWSAWINPNSSSLKQNLVDFKRLLAFIYYNHIAFRLQPLSSHYQTNCTVTGLLIWKKLFSASRSFVSGPNTGRIGNSSIHFTWVLPIHRVSVSWLCGVCQQLLLGRVTPVGHACWTLSLVGRARIQLNEQLKRCKRSFVMVL